MKRTASDTPVVNGNADVSFKSRLYGAFWGYFIGDALSMPCHGYAVPKRIRADYGAIEGYRDPLTPHPQSDLFRTHYSATGERGEIMHGREAEWRIPGTHFHQHLKGGDNTLNILLGRELLQTVADNQKHEPEAWEEAYTSFLLDPNRHQDTYIPASHRAFFANYGRGKDAWQCGTDSNRIGGIALVLPLAIRYAHNMEEARRQVRKALSLTHKGEPIARAADLLVELLIYLLHGYEVEDALFNHIRGRLPHPALNFTYRRWRERLSDENVAENHCKNGSAIDDALPLILYLVLKYQNNFERILLGNANLGGDNCPRGAILGLLAGAAAGCEEIPAEWAQGLSGFEQLDALADGIIAQVK